MGTQRKRGPLRSPRRRREARVTGKLIHGRNHNGCHGMRTRSHLRLGSLRRLSLLQQHPAHHPLRRSRPRLRRHGRPYRAGRGQDRPHRRRPDRHGRRAHRPGGLRPHRHGGRDHGHRGRTHHAPQGLRPQAGEADRRGRQDPGRAQAEAGHRPGGGLAGVHRGCREGQGLPAPGPDQHHRPGGEVGRPHPGRPHHLPRQPRPGGLRREEQPLHPPPSSPPTGPT